MLNLNSRIQPAFNGKITLTAFDENDVKKIHVTDSTASADAADLKQILLKLGFFPVTALYTSGESKGVKIDNETYYGTNGTDTIHITSDPVSGCSLLKEINPAELDNRKDEDLFWSVFNKLNSIFDRYNNIASKMTSQPSFAGNIKFENESGSTKGDVFELKTNAEDDINDLNNIFHEMEQPRQCRGFHDFGSQKFLFTSPDRMAGFDENGNIIISSTPMSQTKFLKTISLQDMPTQKSREFFTLLLEELKNFIEKRGLN